MARSLTAPRFLVMPLSLNLGFLFIIFHPFIAALARRVSLLETRIGEQQAMTKKLIEFWNNWEIRALIMFSVLIHINLVIFGSWRKFSASPGWIRALVWLAFVSLESVATLSIGIISEKQGQLESCTNGNGECSVNRLTALWAALMLGHLGGPDSITAYSLEDNSLWVRNSLGLVCHGGVTAYILIRSWTSGDLLSYWALLIVVLGVIKYGERIWVLKSAKFDIFMEDDERIEKELQIPEAAYLEQARHLMGSLGELFNDGAIVRNDGDDVDDIMLKSTSSEAFKLVQVELGFIYDALYTKATLIYKKWGIIMRPINLLFSVSTLVVFSIVYKNARWGPGVARSDVAITFLLISGTMAVEIYSLLQFALSEWAMLWLSKQKGTIAKIMYRVISSIRQALLDEMTGWSSRRLKQYNPVTNYLYAGRWHLNRILYESEFMFSTVLYDLLEGWSVGSAEVTAALQELIFEQLLDKRARFRQKGHRHDALKELLAERGDYTLRETDSNISLRILQDLTGKAEFSESLIVWNFATNICYYCLEDLKSCPSPSREISKTLADYVMYLQTFHPKMLPSGDFKIRSREFTAVIWADLLRKLKDRSCDTSVGDAFTLMFEQRQKVYNLVIVDRIIAPDNIECMILAETLGNLVKERTMSPEKVWEMMSRVWVEMLTYAAAWRSWEEHLKELQQGGELLTHVAILMVNLGLNEQVQFTDMVVDKHMKEVLARVRRHRLRAVQDRR